MLTQMQYPSNDGIFASSSTPAMQIPLEGIDSGITAPAVHLYDSCSPRLSAD